MGGARGCAIPRSSAGRQFVAAQGVGQDGGQDGGRKDQAPGTAARTAERQMTEQAQPQPAAEEPAAVPLHRIPVVIVTRFSFFGKSGWKSDASRDRALLFQPERLQHRLRLFSQITLPSLAAQTRQDFHHFILTSRDLPEPTAAALAEACARSHGDAGRYSIVAARPMPARAALRRFLDRRYPGQVVAQVALDDDDGLAADFVQDLRRQFGLIEEETPDISQKLPHFVSYSRGFGLMLRDAAEGAPTLFRIRYPYINLGLTMIAGDHAKNILAIQHKKAPRRFGARLIGDTPMYVRGIHDFNDSRVEQSERWVPQEGDDQLKARFPFLFAADGVAGWAR